MRTRLRLPAAVLAFVVALSTGALAQSMEERLEQKLKKPFVKNAAWVQDYYTALQQAKDSNKIVFGYFTRSYAP